MSRAIVFIQKLHIDFTQAGSDQHRMWLTYELEGLSDHNLQQVERLVQSAATPS